MVKPVMEGRGKIIRPGSGARIGGGKRVSPIYGPGGAVRVLGSFKKGGRVKKTGCYRLHKGEYVIRKRKK